MTEDEFKDNLLDLGFTYGKDYFRELDEAGIKHSKSWAEFVIYLYDDDACLVIFTFSADMILYNNKQLFIDGRGPQEGEGYKFFPDTRMEALKYLTEGGD